MPHALLFSVVAFASVLVGAIGVHATQALDEPISARVETQRDDGSWATVATPQPWGVGGPIYPSDRHPRLVVVNRHPSTETVVVDISYYLDGTVQVLREEWTLGPFEKRVEHFTVPERAFWPHGARVPNEGVLVYVNVDDLGMSVSVGRT